jgi:hypothetical protein
MHRAVAAAAAQAGAPQHAVALACAAAAPVGSEANCCGIRCCGFLSGCRLGVPVNCCGGDPRGSHLHPPPPWRPIYTLTRVSVCPGEPSVSGVVVGVDGGLELWWCWCMGARSRRPLWLTPSSGLSSEPWIGCACARPAVLAWQHSTGSSQHLVARSIASRVGCRWQLRSSSASHSPVGAAAAVQGRVYTPSAAAYAGAWRVA